MWCGWVWWWCGSGVVCGGGVLWWWCGSGVVCGGGGLWWWCGNGVVCGGGVTTPYHTPYACWWSSCWLEQQEQQRECRCLRHDLVVWVRLLMSAIEQCAISGLLTCQ